MKKTIISFFLCLLLVFAVSCESAEAVANNALLDDGAVKKVEVTSMPEGYYYTFVESEAETVASYIRSLHLEDEFPEDPNVYAGMTWVVDIEYDGADTTTVYMFGNMFIRRDSSEWLRMEYSEAEGFASLLEKLDK